MSPAIQPPWVDGEKIPDDRIRTIFRQPPGAPQFFQRNYLVVGSRGVGKTTLIRYHKEIHQGVALHVSLATELGSLTKQTALGPLAQDWPASLEPQLAGKATTMLALTLAERLIRKGVATPVGSFKACLPGFLAEPLLAVDEEVLPQLRRHVIRTPLESFEELAAARPLPQFLSELGDAARRTRGPLLLLLDRADMASPPALAPVFDLLDQSGEYVVVVTTRPGHGGKLLANLIQGIVPGDHFDVAHLGDEPRSDAWKAFMWEAIMAQLADQSERLPTMARNLVLAMARDSLRTALELAGEYVLAAPETADRRLVNAINAARERQLGAARSTLQRYHPDFLDLIGRIRRDVTAKGGSLDRPVILELRHSRSGDLFDAPSPVDSFLNLALRVGAICVPEGQRWMPGVHLREFEIPLILTWRPTELTTVADTSKTERITLTDSEVLQAGGGRPKPPSIFAAFRFDYPESQRFRDDLARALARHGELSRLVIADGRVPAGTPWAEAIRKRIRKARLAVGDVTGMRPDVQFELGFAYGLGKPRIPVVANPASRSALPEWAGATQVGHFADEAGMRGIISSIHAHLTDPEFTVLAQPPTPIPGLTVWARTMNWNRHASDQCATIAAREGLIWHCIEDAVPNESIIRRAAQASFLVVSLDGTAADSLMHYICGAVVAKPATGQGQRLSRRILVLCQPGTDPSLVVAASLRRCQDIVSVAAIDDVLSHVNRFARDYRDWLKKSEQAPGGRRRRRRRGTRT